MRGEISGVLLAAGQGSRFGGNKLLHPLDHDLPMVVAAGRRLKAAVPRAIAVVDDTDGAVAGLLGREGFDIVMNPRAAEGLGTSIARGVAASRGASGWVIALADMPFIPVDVIRQVVDGLLQGASIIAPACGGQRGHPVGFSARHAEALMQLAGDEGARGIIRNNSESLVLIEVGEAGVIMDIDTPDSIRADVSGNQ